MKTQFFLLFLTILLAIFAACEPAEKQHCDCEALRRPAFTADVQGAETIQLRGTEAGLPLASMPGIQTITTEELLQLEEEPKTGLFLIDTDFVPQELAEDLKEEGYTLNPAGALDSAGVQIALFVQAAVYKLELRDTTGQNLPDSLDVTRPRPQAFPQPWAGYSYSFWWKYNGGFCRSYEARTRAYAYGPRVGDFWPYTNIQWMQTYARAGGTSDSDVCSNCYQQSSYVNRGIGCFWPAHGGASGNHFMYMYDSGASAYITWGWSH